MNLRMKLFYSHVFVTVLSIITVAIIALVISNFAIDEINEDHQAATLDADGNLRIETIEETTFDANETMQSALLIGLGVAGVISIGIALVVSLALSQRMIMPIRAMTEATSRIAEGNYTQRVSYQSHDELGQLADHFNLMATSLDNTETIRRELLADLTHELNTPLTSIMAAIEGLQDGTITDTETNHGMIYDEARRLQRLVRDVQYLSNVEADSYVLQREPLIANDVVQSAISRLAVQYESKGVQLIAELPKASPTICGDRDRIMQVLINLLGNALQNTPSGGQVIVAVQRCEQHAKFTITDTGIGIAKTDLKRIFDRFYRGDKSRNRRSGGSGIGLTIAHTIVTAHDGRIWAESQGVGHGSQFHMTIPLETTLSKLDVGSNVA